MAKLTGAAQFSKKLRNIPDRALAQVGDALEVAGEMIQVEAQTSITEGTTKQGPHIRSLPGQPPNNELGGLADNIETARTGPLTVEVSSNAQYAAALEYGTSKMAERPYMRPALEKKRPEAVETVKRALRAAVAKAE